MCDCAAALCDVDADAMAAAQRFEVLADSDRSPVSSFVISLTRYLMPTRRLVTCWLTLNQSVTFLRAVQRTTSKRSPYGFFFFGILLLFSIVSSDRLPPSVSIRCRRNGGLLFSLFVVRFCLSAQHCGLRVCVWRQRNKRNNIDSNATRHRARLAIAC